MVVLLGVRHPWVNAFFFILGSYLSYLLLGIVVALGARSVLDFLTAEPRPIAYGAGIAIGILLVVLGVRNLKTGFPVVGIDQPVGRGPGRTLSLSLVLTVVTAPAALPYLAAIDLILQSDAGKLELLTALAIYCAVYVAPMIALVTLRSVAGKRSAALLARIHRTVTTSVPRVAAVLVLILGLVIIAEGAAFFLGKPLFESS